jgi:thiamine biosynthesis lipoprotein
MKSSRRKLKRVRPLLGTYVEITLLGNAPEASLNAWMTEGFGAIEEVDRRMSVYRADSDLSRLNRAAPGVWVQVHPFTREVLQVSNDLFMASKGVFDIRCGAAPAGEAPVEVRRDLARKTGLWSFDLGGLAKGYAVDLAVRRIRRRSFGYKLAGVVNAGGDLRAWGDCTAAGVVQLPVGKTVRLRPLILSRTAAATSSVRTRLQAGLSVATHVRMPSGQPLEQEQTVTVFAKRCLLADALTKVVMMAPPIVAAYCLASYRARALVFEPGGQLERVVG